MADLEDDTVTFFDLDESGVEMVFNLNFIGTLLPTQPSPRQMVGSMTYIHQYHHPME